MSNQTLRVVIVIEIALFALLLVLSLAKVLGGEGDGESITDTVKQPAVVASQTAKASVPTPVKTVVPRVTPTPVPTPNPTPSPRPTPSPTPVPIPTKSTLRVELRYSDGSPALGYWLDLFRQETDINGNPISGEGLDGASTGNSGAVNWELDPGKYVVIFRGFGNPLIGGSPFGPDQGPGFGDLIVNAGGTTTLKISSGQLLMTVWRGQCQNDTCIELGEPNPHASLCAMVKVNFTEYQNVLCGETNDQGQINLQLLPGEYLLHLNFGAWGADIGSVTIQELKTVTMNCTTYGFVDGYGQGIAGYKDPTCAR